MAKVLIVNSSSRGKSNSRAMSAKVAEGAARNGHSVTAIDVGNAQIHPCTGCEACRKNPGKCVFDDAMTELYPKVAEAEVLIFCSPIYYFHVNAQMKTFLDRTYALGEGGLKNKRVGGVFAYGDVDPVKSGCINAIRTFQDICAFVSAEWIGAAYGTAWEQGDADNDSALLAAAEEFGKSIA